MRLLIAILCCLMLCGCAAIENNDILTSTPLPSPEADPASAFMEHDNNRKRMGAVCSARWIHFASLGTPKCQA